MSRESSITVAVRIRPLNEFENSSFSYRRCKSRGKAQQRRFKLNQSFGHVANNGRRVSSRMDHNRRNKILETVDDRMLIFDPNSSRSLSELEMNSFPGSKSSAVSRIGCHNRRNREHRFVFDRLFDEDSSQSEVYSYTGKPLLDSVLEGYNATIFAYGATGCGKTFTITGTPENPGIIFLAMSDLFRRIQILSADRSIKLTLTYLEIYNEKIRDLLNPNTDPNSLQLLEDKHKRVLVLNLSQHHPKAVQEVLELIKKGNRYRTVSPTAANAVSSRSHAVLQITLEQTPKGNAAIDGKQIVSTLSFIDLAGSERASATRNRGVRLHEGANINKSLLALGNCIKVLSKPSSKTRIYVPYRDSKLTRLLKFSLGGNCKTVMVVCVSPSVSHYDETLNALKYADRAKSIRTKILRNTRDVNQHISSYLNIIKDQKKEIQLLKANSQMLVRREMAKYADQTVRCRNELDDAIKSIQKSVQKADFSQSRRAQIIAKVQFLEVELNRFEHVLGAFRRCKSSLSCDEIFKDLIKGIEELCLYIRSLVSGLNKELDHSTELNLIFQGTPQVILRKLQELEGWNDTFDSLFTTRVQLMEEQVERSILQKASEVLSGYMKNSGSRNTWTECLMNSLDVLFQLCYALAGKGDARFEGDFADTEVGVLLLDKCHEILRILKASVDDISESGFGLLEAEERIRGRTKYSFSSPKKNKVKDMPELMYSKITPTKRAQSSSMRSPLNKKINAGKVLSSGFESSSIQCELKDTKSDLDGLMTNVDLSPDFHRTNNDTFVAPSKRLTSRTLAANTQIGSPGRMTGLGIPPYISSSPTKEGKFFMPIVMSKQGSGLENTSGEMDIDDGRN